MLWQPSRKAKMKKLFTLLTIIFASSYLYAKGGGGHSGGGHSGHSSHSSTSGSKSVHVQGYTRKDGTVVSAYNRNPPHSNSFISVSSRDTPRTEAETNISPRTSVRQSAPSNEIGIKTYSQPKSVIPISMESKNGVRTEVKSVRYRKILFQGPNSYMSKDLYLKVDVFFYGNRQKRYDYQFLGSQKPRLFDDLGREYFFISIDDKGHYPIGFKNNVNIPDVGSTRSELIFTCPEYDCSELTLILPSNNVFGDNELIYKWKLSDIED